MKQGRKNYGMEKGTKHFDWINIYNSNGQRIQFLGDGWNYSCNTAQSVYTKKMNLHKGGYYINLHEIYNCFYNEKDQGVYRKNHRYSHIRNKNHRCQKTFKKKSQAGLEENWRSQGI